MVGLTRKIQIKLEENTQEIFEEIKDIYSKNDDHRQEHGYVDHRQEHGYVP